jgi:hypothetical protein
VLDKLAARASGWIIRENLVSFHCCFSLAILGPITKVVLQCFSKLETLEFPDEVSIVERDRGVDTGMWGCTEKTDTSGKSSGRLANWHGHGPTATLQAVVELARFSIVLRQFLARHPKELSYPSILDFRTKGAVIIVGEFADNTSPTTTIRTTGADTLLSGKCQILCPRCLPPGQWQSRWSHNLDSGTG